jgi:ankyrin repeat domain-containing protein 50
MLVGISRSCWERAQRILTLLCLSSRPLTVFEVIDAIAVDIQKVERYNPDRKLENADDLLRICPGLIDITAHAPDKGTSPYTISLVDESMTRTEMVRIADFSVQEYLLSHRIAQGRAAPFAISETAGHFQISKTCLIYLCNQDFLDQALTRSLIEQYPFARFVSEFWYHHYRLVDKNGATDLEEWVLALLQTRARLERWIRLYNVHRPWNNEICYDEKAKMYTAPIYCASLLGIDGVLAHILSIPAADVNAQGGFFGNALQAASEGGHEKVVQMLLSAGADVNAQGGFLGNALQAASRSGHEKVVQILLDAGADFNAQGGHYGNVLRAASYTHHEKVVQILLDAGADVNTQGGAYTSALLAASRCDTIGRNHEKVVQVLLDAGADVNAQGELEGNALQAASSLGHVKVVQMLLDRGADVNARGGHYGNALQAASSSGHEKVVQILLDAGADVNAQGRETYYSALLEASRCGAIGRNHEKVVQILLDAGANVNTQGGGTYENALQAASRSGHEKVVQMLLDRGVDVNAQGGEYSNALQGHHGEVNEKVVQMLLDRHADCVYLRSKVR